MHSFTFDEINSRSHCGLFVSGGGTFNVPERDIESIPIPGRNGELTIDHGRFSNIVVTYSGWINCKTDTEFRQKYDLAKNWLCSRIGYKRLEDDYHPDEYRMARFINGLQFAMFPEYNMGKTVIQFDCMPQRWLKSGEDPISIVTPSGSTLQNPTSFSSKPLVTVYGTGEATIFIGETNISISDIGGSVTLDSEIERAYNGLTSRTNTVTTDNGYPILHPGRNVVNFRGDGVTSITIIPRWWQI